MKKKKQTKKRKPIKAQGKLTKAGLIHGTCQCKGVALP